MSVMHLLHFALAFVVSSAVVAGQSTTPAAAAQEAEAQEVEQRIRAVEADESLDPAVKKTALSLLGEARDAQSAAAATRRSLSSYEAELEKAATDLARIRAELTSGAQPLPMPPAVLDTSPADALAQLEAAFADAQRAQGAASDELRLISEELRRVEQRQSTLPQEVEARRNALATAAREEQIPAATPAVIRDAMVRRQRARIEAARVALAASERWLADDPRYLPYLSVQRELALRLQGLHDARVATLRGRVAAARAAVADAAATAARETAGQIDARLQFLAEQNAAFADETKAFTARLVAVQLEIAKREALRVELRQEFDDAKQLIAVAGLTEAAGQDMRRLRDQMRAQRRSSSRSRRNPSDELSRVQIARVRADRALRSLVALDDRAQMVVAGLGVAGMDAATLEARARVLLRAQRESALATQDVTRRLSKALVDLEALQRQIVKEATEAERFLNERVLWIRSDAPLWSADWTGLVGAVAWLGGFRLWTGVVENLLTDLTSKPLPWLAALAVLIALLAMRRWHKRRLDATARLVGGDPANDRFVSSLLGLWLTALLVLPLPLVLAFLAWRFEVVGSQYEIASALGSIVLPATLIQSLRVVSRAKGLGVAHLEWSPTVASTLRRWASVLTVSLLPLLFVIRATEVHAEPAWLSSLGRLCLIAALALVAASLHRFLHPERLVRQAKLHRRVLATTHKFAVALPLVLALLAVGGYVFTAIEVLDRIIATLGLALAVCVLHGFALRWIRLSKARVTQGALAGTSESTTEAASTATDPLQEGGDGLDTELEVPEQTIDQHVGQLLRTVVLIASLIGGYLIWADVLPAVNFLGDIDLWSQTVTVQEQDPAGGAELKTVQRVVPITLAGLGVALLYIVLGVLLARNLPGVLQLGFYRHTALDAGARYAITTLIRYVIFLLVLFLAFRRLGVDWSSVQWLAAAVTVGLGFGLQEIFANFVSGVIILFERPIRIGDIVTVGTTEGRVTRIRMRATVITDWDRRELLVPNREFITGQVVNWTLTDPVTRLVIPFSVAYGSDVGRAQRLALDVARHCRGVLHDPVPSVVFRNFGDSSLDLQLRVFLPSRDNWLEVMNEVRLGLVAKLKEAGIEIPFPQRDLHIRSTVETRRAIPGDG